MESYSALLSIWAGNSPVTGEFPAQRSVTRSFDFFISACLNGWAHIGEAGNLRRHRAHYDVTVMLTGSRTMDEMHERIPIFLR